MMSHEIRTPLNGIIGMLRLLESELNDRGDEARLTTARVSAENLLDLSNDILTTPVLKLTNSKTTLFILICANWLGSWAHI